MPGATTKTRTSSLFFDDYILYDDWINASGALSGDVGLEKSSSASARKRKSIRSNSSPARASIGLGLGMEVGPEQRAAKGFQDYSTDDGAKHHASPKLPLAPKSTTVPLPIVYSTGTPQSRGASPFGASPPQFSLPDLPQAYQKDRRKPNLKIPVPQLQSSSPSLSYHSGSSLLHQAPSSHPLIDQDMSSHSTPWRTKPTPPLPDTITSPSFDGNLMSSFPPPPVRKEGAQGNPSSGRRGRAQGKSSFKKTHCDVLPAPPRQLVIVNEIHEDVKNGSNSGGFESSGLNEEKARRDKSDDDDDDDDTSLAYLAIRSRRPHSRMRSQDLEKHFGMRNEEARLVLDAGNFVGRSSRRQRRKEEALDQAISPDKPLPLLPRTCVPSNPDRPNLRMLRKAGELHAWTVGFDADGCPRIAPKPSAFHSPSCRYAGHPIVSTMLCGCRAAQPCAHDDSSIPHVAAKRRFRQEPSNLNYKLRSSSSAPDLLDLAVSHNALPELLTKNEQGSMPTELASETDQVATSCQLENQRRELQRLRKQIARLSSDARAHRETAKIQNNLSSSIELPVRGSSHGWAVVDGGVENESWDGGKFQQVHPPNPPLDSPRQNVRFDALPDRTPASGNGKTSESLTFNPLLRWARKVPQVSKSAETSPSPTTLMKRARTPEQDKLSIERLKPIASISSLKSHVRVSSEPTKKNCASVESKASLSHERSATNQHGRSKSAEETRPAGVLGSSPSATSLKSQVHGAYPPSTRKTRPFPFPSSQATSRPSCSPTTPYTPRTPPHRTNWTRAGSQHGHSLSSSSTISTPSSHQLTFSPSRSRAESLSTNATTIDESPSTFGVPKPSFGVEEVREGTKIQSHAMTHNRNGPSMSSISEVNESPSVQALDSCLPRASTAPEIFFNTQTWAQEVEAYRAGLHTPETEDQRCDGLIEQYGCAL